MNFLLSVAANKVGEKSRNLVLRLLQFPASSEAVDAAVCRRGIPDESLPLNIPEETMKLRKCVPHLSIWRWLPTSGQGTGTPLNHFTFLPSHQRNEKSAQLEGYGPLVRCATPRLLKRIQERYELYQVDRTIDFSLNRILYVSYLKS